MFGYIIVNKPELKFKEFDIYQSYYCGFCNVLKEKYGRSGQLTISYDMTFLIMVLTGLYEPEEKYFKCRCIAHPVKEHPVITNYFTEYASDMNIILSYYKGLDDWRDEKKVSALAIKGMLKKKYGIIYKKYEEKADKIFSYMNELNEREQADEKQLDVMAGLFGKIMEEIFAVKKDEWEDTLRSMGFYLGKFIYILDAYDDIEKDIKKENYNPLIDYYTKPDFYEKSKNILTMMMAECTRHFERLPIIENVEILRNILYAGVWCRFEAITEKRKEKEK